MEREKIQEVVIDTKISAPELPQKVAQALSGNIPELEPSDRLGLDVIFNKTVYHQVGFYRYELTQEHKDPAPKTDQEKTRQKIYDILDEQLDKVILALKELGCVFGNTGIIGDDLEDDMVHIVLYRQQASATSKGKRTAEISVRNVMPDRPFIVKQAGEMMAKLFLEQMRKENAIEIAKKNHTPNWVSAGELFAAISGALDGETEDTITANKLIGTAYMASDWPLHMRTKAVVVLKDLKKVPYSLFAETDDGLIAVPPCEANAYKKLHVSGQKAR